MGNKKNTENQETKIELHYYEALSQPVKPEELPMMAAEDTVGMLKKNPVDAEQIRTETTDMHDKPAASQTMQPDAIPVKTSKKAATFKKTLTATNADVSEKTQDSARPEKPKNPEKKEPEPSAGAESGSVAAYTIQVAAFKSFKDAVTQTAVLDQKGFVANRTSKEIDGVTWYRVRVGDFATQEAARRHLEKLNQAGINGMIIKKE